MNVSSYTSPATIEECPAGTVDFLCDLASAAILDDFCTASFADLVLLVDFLSGGAGFLF